ncbi:unnamed protein product [Ceutorhynchus assimilis]|uniref:Uncharacterized protein n=1 Tax=Ceutorhynchus assimilis TaxID=467358 RepID=A0A9N9QGI8_9CUCU|nr:unnamed protein product [Ceutorhynchus assimilis]
MVRTYVRKTERSQINEAALKNAICEVLRQRMSERVAARTFNVKRDTLHSRIKKLRRKYSPERLVRMYNEDSGNESSDQENSQPIVYSNLVADLATPSASSVPSTPKPRQSDLNINTDSLKSQRITPESVRPFPRPKFLALIVIGLAHAADKAQPAKDAKPVKDAKLTKDGKVTNKRSIYLGSYIPSGGSLGYSSGLTDYSGFGSLGGISSYSTGNTHSHTHEVQTITQHVPVPVPKPYAVPVVQRVAVPQPYPVHVSHPVAVPVQVRVPVEVPRPYPVHVNVPVPYAVKVPVEVPRPYPVAVHTPVHHVHSYFLALIVIGLAHAADKVQPAKDAKPVKDAKLTKDGKVTNKRSIYLGSYIPSGGSLGYSSGLTDYSGFGGLGGISSYSTGNTHSHTHEVQTITQHVPVAVPKPYAVPVVQRVAVPQPYPVHVSHPVAVPVQVRVPVEVPRPYPVHVNVPVPYAVKVPVEVPRPYPVAVHTPVHVHSYASSYGSGSGFGSGSSFGSGSYGYGSSLSDC